MSRLRHHHEFEGLDEVALVIDYDYERAEPEEEFYPGCPENAVISSVYIHIGDNYSSITSLITEDFRAELVEHCLEDHRGGE
jgi:hypothetical protein